MAKFKSSFKNLCIDVCVNGSSMSVRFTTTSPADNYGTFFTASKDIANALMTSKFYGKYYEREDAEPIEPEAEPKKEYAEVFEDVHRTQEANKILVEKYGINRENLKSKDDALKAAEELNISFPNL